MASTLLLILGILAAVYAVNALRPARNMALCGISWAMAWTAVELAPHLIALDLVVVPVLIAFGALDSWTGWVGLGLVAATIAVSVPMIVGARRTAVDLVGAAADFEGGHIDLSDQGSSDGVKYPRHHIALPFLAWRRRDVRRETVTYARVGRSRLPLDVYSPVAAPDRLLPAVVEVHGGGWILGSRREQGVPLLTHLAANGWVGFNVDYRLSPRHTWPAQITDVKRAISWVRENGPDYGADPAFIALTGGSAGGHLTALAALTAGDPAFQPGFEEADTSVDAAIPFYGVYDFVDEDAINIPIVQWILERAVFKTRRSESIEPFRAASPVERVHPGAPPFLVVHGDHDSLVPVGGARHFVERLRDVSEQPVHYAEMRWGQHAFDIIPSWRTIPVLELIERWLAEIHDRTSPTPHRGAKNRRQASQIRPTGVVGRAVSDAGAGGGGEGGSAADPARTARHR